MKSQYSVMNNYVSVTAFFSWSTQVFKYVWKEMH